MYLDDMAETLCIEVKSSKSREMALGFCHSSPVNESQEMFL